MMASSSEEVLHELDALQSDVAAWFQRSERDLKHSRDLLQQQLAALEASFGVASTTASSSSGAASLTILRQQQQQPPHHTLLSTASVPPPSQLTWAGALAATPTRAGGRHDTPTHVSYPGPASARPQQQPGGKASPPPPPAPAAPTPAAAGGGNGGGYSLSYDDLIDDVERESRVDFRQPTSAGSGGPAFAVAAGGGAGSTHQQQLRGASSHPMQQPYRGSYEGAAAAANASGASSTASSEAAAAGAASTRPVLPADRHQPSVCVVEFKRQRMMQFDSMEYVAPGEYVVVGGDRGEDIGLVVFCWLAHASPPAAVLKITAPKATDRVKRVASMVEVSQLQGVQAELEQRAKEAAQLKVVEHGLPMRIVDAEFQFDRKKLTFYYQAQQRLDFRHLVRDLYKTFRARIWMEQD